MSEVETASSIHGNGIVVVGDLLLYPRQLNRRIARIETAIGASMAKVMLEVCSF